MLKEYLNTLANAFRSVLGTTDKINAQNFASKVNEVYEKGKAEGGDTETAYNEGVEAGKQAEYDRFWDEVQQNGKRTDYTYTFAGRAWNDKTFVPKYDIVPTNTLHIFSFNMITDLVGILNSCGVRLDTSKDTNTSYLVNNSESLRNLPVLDTRSRKNINYYIYGNTNLKTIEKVILKDDGSQGFNDYSFTQNPKLEDIVFEGVIGKSVSFKDSPLLTDTSQDSIITALKDYSGTTTSPILTVHTTVYNRMVELGKDALITAKNWVLAKA